VTVGELADDQAVNIAGSDNSSTPSPLGLVVEELNEALRQRANTSFGVRVVESSGPAHGAGIRQGDIITRLNNQEVDSVETFNDVVADLERGRSVPVLIVRGQSPTFLALRVPDD
jgi:serine protease Do